MRQSRISYCESNISLKQAIAYKQTGSYINRQKELLQVVSSNEQVIVETFMNLKIGGAIDFNLMSETLFSWSKKWISENS